MAARLEDRSRLEDRPRPDQRSLGSLIGDLANETTTLVRKEVELAKAEMSEKIDKATGAARSIATGSAVLYAGFLVLLIAVVAGLDTVLDRWYPTQWLAALIVGVVVLFVGYLMLRAGRRRFEKDVFVPRRTLRSLQRDAKFMQRDDAVTANPDPTGALRAQRMTEERR